MKPLTNEELGLDKDGFPPQDEWGNDLMQIQDNLRLTPDERLRKHEEFLKFVRVVQRARSRPDGCAQGTDTPAE